MWRDPYQRPAGFPMLPPHMVHAAGFAPPHVMGGYMYFHAPMDPGADNAPAHGAPPAQTGALSCADSAHSITSRPSQSKSSIRTRAASADTARSGAVHATKGAAVFPAKQASAAVRAVTVDYTGRARTATARPSARSVASEGSSAVAGGSGRGAVPVPCQGRTGSDSGARHPATAPAPALVHLDLAQADKWLQCDRCLRWRRVPESVPTSRLRKWQCSMNGWDPTTASCDAPEEADPDDALTVEEVQSTLRRLEQEAQPPRLRLGPARDWAAETAVPGPARAAETAQDRTRRTQRILRLRRRLDRFAAYSARRAEFKQSLLRCVCCQDA